MKENIGLMMKIVAKSTLKFVLVLTGGVVFCILSILVSYYSLSHHPDAGSTIGHAGHTGSALAIVLLWFKLDVWSAILFFASLLVFPFLYFMVANKTAIQTAIHLLWSNKVSDWIRPKIHTYLEKLEARQPDWLRTTSDGAIVKLKLLEANKNDSETPKLQKRVISYLLRKVKLDDVDFQKDSVQLSSILSSKLLQTINDAASPSNSFFLMVFGIHFLLFLITLFT